MISVSCLREIARLRIGDDAQQARALLQSLADCGLVPDDGRDLATAVITDGTCTMALIRQGRELGAAHLEVVNARVRRLTFGMYVGAAPSPQTAAQLIRHTAKRLFEVWGLPSLSMQADEMVGEPAELAAAFAWDGSASPSPSRRVSDGLDFRREVQSGGEPLKAYIFAPRTSSGYDVQLQGELA